MSDPILTDEEKTAAEATLARIINNHPLHVEDGARFTDAEVEITRGFKGELDHGNLNESKLNITVKTPDAIDHAPELMALLRNVLKEIPAVESSSQIESTAEHNREFAEKLHELKRQGVEIPDAVFKWRGLSEDESKTRDIDNYAVRFGNINERGVSADLHISMGFHEDVSAQDLSEKVAENLRGREESIKQAIIAGAEEALPNLTSEEKDSLRELDLDIRTYSSDRWSSVYIDIKSPKQKELEKNPGEEPEDAKALMDSNVLSNLTSEQMGKIVGKAVLHSDEQAQDIWPLAAGRKDIQSAIKYAIRAYEAEHPEQETKNMHALLNDEIFEDGYQWRKDPDERTVQPHKPEVTASESPKILGEKPSMTFSFTLPAGKADDIIRSIAELGRGSGQEFAQVDSVELVGASTPDLFREAQAIMAQNGQSQPTNQEAVETSLKPLAEQLVLNVETAHQAIQDAIAKAADQYKNAEIPSPMVSQVTQLRQLDTGQQQAV